MGDSPKTTKFDLCMLNVVRFILGTVISAVVLLGGSQEPAVVSTTTRVISVNLSALERSLTKSRSHFLEGHQPQRLERYIEHQEACMGEGPFATKRVRKRNKLPRLPWLLHPSPHQVLAC